VAGAGDPEALVTRMSPQWQSREVVDVLRWLRGFNSGRTDQVRFVGVEYYLTGRDLGTPAGQELADLGPVVHVVDATTSWAAEGVELVPLSIRPPTSAHGGVASVEPRGHGAAAGLLRGPPRAAT
jgi:hypothetical protein